MTEKAKSGVTRSSGNVFRDLGFPSEKEVRARGLKQARAARLLGITQPRVSDLLRGRIDLFSADMLIDLLARLGVKVRLVTSNRRKVA